MKKRVDPDQLQLDGMPREAYEEFDRKAWEERERLESLSPDYRSLILAAFDEVNDGVTSLLSDPMRHVYSDDDVFKFTRALWNLTDGVNTLAAGGSALCGASFCLGVACVAYCRDWAQRPCRSMGGLLLLANALLEGTGRALFSELIDGKRERGPFAQPPLWWACESKRLPSNPHETPAGVIDGLFPDEDLSLKFYCYASGLAGSEFDYIAQDMSVRLSVFQPLLPEPPKKRKGYGLYPFA